MTRTGLCSVREDHLNTSLVDNRNSEPILPWYRAWVTVFYSTSDPCVQLQRLAEPQQYGLKLSKHIQEINLLFSRWTISPSTVALSGRGVGMNWITHIAWHIHFSSHVWTGVAGDKLIMSSFSNRQLIFTHYKRLTFSFHTSTMKIFVLMLIKILTGVVRRNQFWLWKPWQRDSSFIWILLINNCGSINSCNRKKSHQSWCSCVTW